MTTDKVKNVYSMTKCGIMMLAFGVCAAACGGEGAVVNPNGLLEVSSVDQLEEAIASAGLTDLHLGAGILCLPNGAKSSFVGTLNVNSVYVDGVCVSLGTYDADNCAWIVDTRNVVVGADTMLSHIDVFYRRSPMAICARNPVDLVCDHLAQR